MATNFNAINRAASFNPTGPFPLDKRSYFESKATADQAVANAQVAATTSKESNYYIGQLITVKDDDTDSSVDTYEIGNDNKLHKLDRTEDRQAAIAALDSNSAEASSGSFLTYVELVDGKFDTAKTKTASNAATATKFSSTRTITLTGSVTGEASSDGESGWEIATTTNHNHDDLYVNVDGDAMTGPLKFASGIFNPVGDEVSFGCFKDSAGMFALTASNPNNNCTGISFYFPDALNDGFIKGVFDKRDAATNKPVIDRFLFSHGLEAPSYNATSDARLKENFQPLSTEKSILDLPTYKFDFINGAKNQIGCKAQDLQEICPEIVDEGSDGYLSIQESKIVYLLLEEVKKLRKEIDELKGV